MDALRLTDRRQDEFLAILAHGLRNPMSTIRSGLQILSVVGAKDQISSDAVAMMSRHTEHLVHMVDDLRSQIYSASTRTEPDWRNS